MKTYIYRGRPNRKARKNAKLAGRKYRAIRADVEFENRVADWLLADIEAQREALINDALLAVAAAQQHLDAEEFAADACAQAEHDRMLDQAGLF